MDEAAVVHLPKASSEPKIQLEFKSFVWGLS